MILALPAADKSCRSSNAEYSPTDFDYPWLAQCLDVLQALPLVSPSSPGMWGYAKARPILAEISFVKSTLQNVVGLASAVSSSGLPGDYIPQAGG